MGSLCVGLMLTLLVCVSGSVGVCPRPCACSTAAEVHCTFRALLSVPAGVSPLVQRINYGFNAISQVSVESFRGLRKLELLMMHGNNLQDVPDGAFRDQLSLQVLKLSYNKLRVITGRTFSGLTGLVRLHLDHNHLEFLHPDAFRGMRALRLLHLESNRLQQLHPDTFSTFSVLRRFPVSTLRHLHLSENQLRSLPRRLLENTPLLENLFLYGNPWSCDCRMSWIQDWSARNSGVMKCKKDRAFSSGQLCPLCASPEHLKGEDISDLKELLCSGPVIRSPGRNVSREDTASERLPLDRIKPPFGNVSLALSDQHGTKVDLMCQILEPWESAKISWNYSESLQISANVSVTLDVECPLNRDDYESFWRILAYYSDVPVHLRREIMLSREPALGYRYRQDVEKDAYFYTGVRANVYAHPPWLMQSLVNIKLNRPYSSSKMARLVLDTRLTVRSDEETLRRWVMIQHDNRTRMSFTAVVGGEIEMHCRVQSSGNAIVRWMLPDGSEINAGFRSSDNRASVSIRGTLHMTAVALRDSGVYYCVAELSGEVDVLPFRLSVVESSTPLPGEDVGNALTRFVGESALLPCVSTAAPDAEVSWIIPDGSVLSARTNTSRALLFPNGTLSFPLSQLNDNGYYKCVAVNQHGVDALPIKLTVMRRRGIPALRPFPIRPQSAAGVSTRVKAFLEDVEEASGDGSERMVANRSFVNRRRGPDGNMRRRRPFRKEGNAFTNQRPVNTKTKIDPQKWADLLAKIREKSSAKNTDHVVQNEKRSGQSVGVDQWTESSSGDAGPQEETDVHHTHTEGHVRHTAPPQLHTTSDGADPTSGAPHVMTEVSAENNRVQSGSVIKPETETENEPGNTGVRSEIEGFDSGRHDSTLFSTTSTVSTRAPPSSTQTRAKEQWRRRFGGRRRIKFRRPWSTSTVGRVHNPDPTLKTDPRKPAEDPATPAADHIYSTTQLTPTVYPSIPLITHIYSTVPDKSTSIHPTGPITTHIYSTNPSESTSFTPTAPETYSTIPDESSSVHSTIPATSVIHSTTASSDPTASHSRPTVQRELPNAIEENIMEEETEFRKEKDIQIQETTGSASHPASAVSEYGDLSSSEVDEDRSVVSMEETEHVAHPTSRAGAETDAQLESTSSLLTPLPQTDPTEISLPLDTHSPQSHLTGVQSGFTSTTENVTPTDTPIVSSIPQTQQFTPSTSETQTQSVDDSPPTPAQKETNEIDLQPNLVSKAEQRESSVYENLINSTASLNTFTITTSPITEEVIRFTTQLSRTVAPSTALETTDTLYHTTTATITTTTTSPTTSIHPVPDNRIPFYSRNPETNYIDTEHRGRIPNANHGYPYYYNRNPSVNVRPGVIRTPPSVVLNIKTTTAPVKTTTTDASETSSTAQPNNQIQIPESVDRQTNAGVLSRGPPDGPVLQTRPRISAAKLHTISVNAGTDVRLPCESVGEPKPLLTWTKVSTGAVMSPSIRLQRFEVQPNGTFVIHDVQLQDRGQYLCSARNVYGVDKMMVTLVVTAHAPRVTLPRHQDVTVHLGNTALLECRAHGLPIPSISWVLPDGSMVRTVSDTEQRLMLLSNGTLQVKQTSYLDKGIYKCVASNAAGADMLSVRLQVAALPPVIQEPRWENLTVSDGRSALVHCSAKGSPGPAVRWVTVSGVQLRPSQFISSNLFVFPNGTLFIRSPTEKDSGVYECVAVNSVGVAKRSVNLQVTRSSSAARITNTSAHLTDVQYGDTLHLHCSATGSPSPRIIWRTPAKKLVDAYYSFDHRMKVFANGSLSITSVTESDGGDYLCVARNKMGDDYILLKVNVMMRAAQIVPSERDRRVSYGGALKVDCIALGLPNPEITWSLPDGTMVNSVQNNINSSRTKRFLMFDNGTLYLNEVGMTEEGDYTCYAQNQIGKDEMKVRIKVLADAPVIRNKEYSVVRVPHGETAVLNCSAKGEPTPDITWTTPDDRIIEPLTARYQISSDGTLLIQKTGTLHTGNYTCSARNVVGMDKKVVYVEVIASLPVINGLESPGIIRKTVLKDQRVLLDCTANGNPFPRIMWVFPNNIVLPAPYYGSRITVHRNGTLDIHAVRMSDSVELFCIARSEGGETKLQVNLEVTEAVDPPHLMSPPLENVPLTIGKTLTLNCSIVGRPAPEISWTLPNGTSLPGGTSVSRFHHRPDGTLVIREPSASEAGHYRCVGRNAGGSVERSVTLESSRTPEILSRYSSLVSIVNGEDLRLHCLSAGHPSPRLTWTLPNGAVLTRPQTAGRHTLLSNGTLAVHRTSVYDRGTYVCQTSNDHGSSSLAVSVIVIAFPPRITSGPAPVTYGRPGVPVRLACVALATPKAEVVWELPDGLQLKVDVQPRLYGNKLLHPQGSLLIQSPSSRDNGVYRCTAKNVVGSDSRSTYIYVF